MTSCAILGIAFGLTTTAAGAQVLEEIIVTAQKREQAIDDVGIAITAFTGEQVNALGFETSTELALMTPGVYINSNESGQNTQFNIRGVSQNDFYDGLESPNSVYIDEAYVTMQQGQTFGMFDLDRVEILKGPQSTLFGRNATGGLVQYVTRKPTFEKDGYLDLTYGSYDQARVEAAIGGPLSDRVAGRVALMYNYFDELIENEYPQSAINLGGSPAGGGEDLFGDDTFAGRGHLLFEPNEEVTLLLSGYGSRARLSAAPQESIPTVAVFDEAGRQINSIYASPTETREAIGPGGVAVPIILDAEILTGTEDAIRPVPGGDLFGYREDEFGDFKLSEEFGYDDINKFDSYGATAKLTWSFADLELISVSDYKHFDKFVGLDVGATPVDQFQFFAKSNAESFSQELRVSGDVEPIRWLAGAYFLRIDSDTDTGFFVLPFSVVAPLFGVGGAGADLVTEAELETTSTSVFGQIDYDLTDTITFIAGVRVIFEDKEYDLEENVYLNQRDTKIDKAIFLFPTRTPFAEDTSDTLWAGKLQLEWQPNDDRLIYAGINRGVKAGSFNAKLIDGSPALSDDNVGYEPEVLTAYEIGFKSTLFNGTTRLNGSFYYYDYNDYQASTFANVSAIVTNEDAKIKGIEFDLTTSPFEGFEFMSGLALSDADVKDVEIAPGIFRDVSPTYSPSVQLSGLARYSWPAFGGEMTAQMNAYYIGHVFQNLRNFSSHKLDSYAIGNARLAWLTGDTHWEVSFFVNNIADETYRVEGFSLEAVCGCNNEHFGKPRWFGGSVRYSF